MREIKFKGRKKGSVEWFEGYLVQDDGSWHVFPENAPNSPDYYEVDSGTIGQFTGLLDKNGVKIWEGDIFFHEEELDNGDDRNYCVCCWLPNRAMFSFLNMDEYIAYYEGLGTDEFLDEQEYYGVEIEDIKKFHRAGNIFDHPNLVTPQVSKEGGEHE